MHGKACYEKTTHGIPVLAGCIGLWTTAETMSEPTAQDEL